MGRFIRRTWPYVSMAAGIAAAILLDPADPNASWWPTAEWAQHALTGVGVGGLVFGIGVMLGVATGSVGLPGINVANPPENGSADELEEIRRQIREVGKEQKAINETAAKALELAQTAMKELLVRGRGA